MSNLAKRVAGALEERLGVAPEILVRAPGRVNLIGEHTDYNDGFVLPMAIDRAVWIALREREDDQVVLFSVDYDQTESFSLATLERGPSSWIEYVKGVAWALQEAGHSLRGWTGAVAGDVPLGAGLSSSAALEMATARAFAEVSGIDWDAKTMAIEALRAENEWVGMNCGIMDQMISAAGLASHALLIDCRSLEIEPVPLPPDTAVVVLDTATRRGLVDSAYNERRAQCEAAASYFGVAALRDVDEATFRKEGGDLPPLIWHRAQHIVSENARTLAAAEAMRQGDAALLGKLMNESHESLRDDFEVSSEALNEIVDCARGHPACYGARMTGGGFGGCGVALVRADGARSLADHVADCYRQRSGLSASIYICTATAGASIVGEEWCRLTPVEDQRPLPVDSEGTRP